MDTIFNLEALRSVYIFKDLNNSIKDVNTSLEKTTKGIQSLSDSFSSFTKSSIEKVKELSSEFKELTQNIGKPQVATISFDTSGAMNEFSKISSMAQGFSELSYKEIFSQTRILNSNSGNTSEEKREDKESLFDKIIDVINKLGEASESIGKVLDLIERIIGKGKNKGSSSGSEGGVEFIPAIVESIGGLIQKALPRLRTIFTAMRAGLSGVMASIGEVGAALLAIPGLGEILLVVAAVVALIIAIKQLWEHSRRFREMIGYIEGAGKAAFHNIGIYVTRLWELAIKPLIKIVVSGFTELFSFVVNIAKGAWEGMVIAFNLAVEVIQMVWNGFVTGIKIAFGTIVLTAKLTWSGMVTTFNIGVETLKTMWNGFVSGFKIAVSVVVNSAKAAWNGIVSSFNYMILGFKIAWNGMVSGFKLVFSGILNFAKAVWNGIVLAFNYAVLGLREGFSVVANIFKGFWSGITTVFKNIAIAFRAVVASIASAFRAVFSFIGSLIEAIWSGVVSVFSTFWKFIVSLFKSVVSVFKAIWVTIVSVFKGIWNMVVGVWSGLVDIFSKFKAWIYDSILNPIIETFSSVWTWIIKLFNTVIDKITGLFAPIKKLLKEIFSSEGTINLDEAGKAGAKNRGAEFDDEKLREKIANDREAADKKGGKGEGKPKKEDAFGGDIFNTKLERQLNTRNFGASALNSVQSRNSAFGGKGSMGFGTGMGGQKSVGNLNITKLIENMNIYNQNNTMSKEAIIQMVREALLTAVADFTLAQKDNY
ncbi:hypothetical protein ACM39_02575 [Chryseobacterium sp. FH2]|uniref:phage tail protein n=1 Tax=Chryseobacterium sp. FH2 TaxID=1674291 RepID=UPI00065A96E3|nr:hypothetical protein [Chryseobacterium sp. FH2]KMQ69943.1 hypothetical protein ACM39_02575 [Chryseobacterium sp. FH2]